MDAYKSLRYHEYLERLSRGETLTAQERRNFAYLEDIVRKEEDKNTAILTSDGYRYE